MTQIVGYSDLEVVSLRGNFTKEAVSQPWRSDSDDLPEPTNKASYQETLASTSTARESNTPRICGLSRKTFLMVMFAVALTLVIVGAVVGGVVGALESKKTKGNANGDGGSSSDNTSSGTNEPSNHTTHSLAVLSDSKLGAVNWTRSDGSGRHAVFYQDGWNSLMVSVWDTKGTTWSSVNVSRKLADAKTPIAMKPATPLAATALGSPLPFSVSAFYLSAGNKLSEVSTTDENLENWELGDLSGSADIQPAASSQLSAVAHYCSWGCAQRTYVAYQDERQSIRLINGSGSDPERLIEHADPGSGLTFIPCTTDGGRNISNARELRIHYNVASQIQEFKFDDQRRWGLGEQLAFGVSLSPNRPQLAASSFILGATERILVVGLAGNGSITSSLYTPATYWQFNANIAFTGGPSQNFSTIAMDTGQRFYGIVNGSIVEYYYKPNQPLELIYTGTVTTPLPS